jgi:hypothetical protein
MVPHLTATTILWLVTSTTFASALTKNTRVGSGSEGNLRASKPSYARQTEYRRLGKSGKSSYGYGKSGKSAYDNMDYHVHHHQHDETSHEDIPEVEIPYETRGEKMLEVTMGGRLLASNLNIMSDNLILLANAFDQTILHVLDDEYEANTYMIGGQSVGTEETYVSAPSIDVFDRRNRKLQSSSEDVLFNVRIRKPCPDCTKETATVYGSQLFREAFGALMETADSGELTSIFCIFADAANVVTEPCQVDITSAKGTSLKMGFKMDTAPTPDNLPMPTPADYYPTYSPTTTPAKEGVPTYSPTAEEGMTTSPILTSESGIPTYAPTITGTLTSSTLPPATGTLAPATLPPGTSLAPSTLPPVTGTLAPITLPPGTTAAPSTLPPATGTLAPITLPPGTTAAPSTLPPATGTLAPATLPPGTSLAPSTAPPASSGDIPTYAPTTDGTLASSTLPPATGTLAPATLPPGSVTLAPATLPPGTTAPPSTLPPGTTLPPATGTLAPITLPPGTSLAPSTLPPAIGTLAPITLPPGTTAAPSTTPPLTGTFAPVTLPPGTSLAPSTLPPAIGTLAPATLPPGTTAAPSTTLPALGTLAPASTSTSAAPTLIPAGALYFDGFESGSFLTASPEWTSQGDGMWELTTERANSGVYSIKSPALLVPDDYTQKTSNVTLTTNPAWPGGNLMFSILGGTNMPFDDVIYYVDDVQVGQASEMTDFESREIPLDAGGHIITFSYKVNPAGIDTFPPLPLERIGSAFIDDVYFLPEGVTTSPVSSAIVSGPPATSIPGSIVPVSICLGDPLAHCICVSSKTLSCIVFSDDCICPIHSSSQCHIWE